MNIASRYRNRQGEMGRKLLSAKANTKEIGRYLGIETNLVKDVLLITPTLVSDLKSLHHLIGRKTVLYLVCLVEKRKGPAGHRWSHLLKMIQRSQAYIARF